MKPRQIESVPHGRVAQAPYNFVELPETIVPAQLSDGRLPDGDRYHPGPDHHTGMITCQIVTCSPLYTRGNVTGEQFAAGMDPKDQPDFFALDPRTGCPVVPASTFRGMLHTLVEIASHGKMERVTRNKQFYRSLGDTSYSNTFVRRQNRVDNGHGPAQGYRALTRAGYIRREGDAWVIDECEYARLDDPLLATMTHAPHPYNMAPDTPSARPDWQYQHRDIYVTLAPSAQWHWHQKQPSLDKHGNIIYRQDGTIKYRHKDQYLWYRKVTAASDTLYPSSVPATLVLTGPMKHKHLHFAFLINRLATHDLPDDVVRRFHGDEQLTKWQEQAFPANQPATAKRDKDGYLRDGEPVFFLLDDNNNVRFFGRAQMFRLPYELSPFDFIPTKQSGDRSPDLAEAIFGYVWDAEQKDAQKQVTATETDAQKKRDIARAGRVFVCDASCMQKDDAEIWLTGSRDEKLTLKILSSPKPTTFQHYLVQPSVDQRELRHYASAPGTDTVIRGYKLYWHKGDINWRDPVVARGQIEATSEQIDEADTQYSPPVKPVRVGVSFQVTIHFENLTAAELGALLWVLRVGGEEQYRLSLGMGKPYGMGAVAVNDLMVRLSDRTARYSALFASAATADHVTWEVGERGAVPTEVDGFVTAFESYVLQMIGADKSASFRTLPRISQLLLLLRWPGPPSGDTGYMDLDAFKSRPVLPTPHQVCGVPAPPRSDTAGGEEAGTELAGPAQRQPGTGGLPPAPPATGQGTPVGPVITAPVQKPNRRPLSPEERERQRREAIERLVVDEWYEGHVTSTTHFGAFVDLGGIDGLVHISQLGPGGYVEKVEDIVQIGQTVRVRVIKIDRDGLRVGLSMREPRGREERRPQRPNNRARPEGSVRPRGDVPPTESRGLVDASPIEPSPPVTPQLQSPSSPHALPEPPPTGRPSVEIPPPTAPAPPPLPVAAPAPPLEPLPPAEASLPEDGYAVMGEQLTALGLAQGTPSLPAASDTTGESQVGAHGAGAPAASTGGSEGQAERPKIGSIVDGVVVTVNKKKSTLMARLQTTGEELVQVTNLTIFDVQELEPGAVVKIRIDGDNPLKGTLRRKGSKDS